MNRDPKLNSLDLDEEAMEAPFLAKDAQGLPIAPKKVQEVPALPQNAPYSSDEWRRAGTLEAVFRLPGTPIIDASQAPTVAMAPLRQRTPNTPKGGRNAAPVRPTPGLPAYVPVNLANVPTLPANLAQRSITPKMAPKTAPTRAAAAEAFSLEKWASTFVSGVANGASRVASTVGGWFSRGVKAFSNGIKNTATYLKNSAKELMEAFVPNGKLARRVGLAATVLLGAHNFGPTTSSVSMASDTAPTEVAAEPGAMATPEEVKPVSSKWVEKNADGTVSSTAFAKAKTAELQKLADELAPTLDLDGLNADTFDADAFTVTKESHNGMGVLQALASASPEFNNALETESGLRTVVFDHVVGQFAAQGMDANVMEIGTQLSMTDNTVTMTSPMGDIIQFELIPGLESSPEVPAPAPASAAPDLEVDPMDAPLPPTLTPPAPDVVPGSLLDGALGEPTPSASELPEDPMDAPEPRALLRASAGELREQIREKRQTISQAVKESIGVLDLKPLLDEDFGVEDGKYVGTYQVYLPVFDENGDKAWTLLPYPRITQGTFVYADYEHPKLVAELRFLDRVTADYLPLFVDAMTHYDPKKLEFNYDVAQLGRDWTAKEAIPVATTP